jgi:polar amino acid transport system permease protein
MVDRRDAIDCNDNPRTSPFRPLMTTSRARAVPHNVAWWLIAILGLVAWLVVEALANDLYRQILSTVSEGIGVTVFVSLVAFAAATLWGLALALGLQAGPLVVRQLARLYCEVMRGVPVLVLLFYVAFVGAPALLKGIDAIALRLLPAGSAAPFEPRDFSLMWRAILALTLSYSAFIAEVFRAGFQSVARGQTDAARSLGMTPRQVFRHVTLPLAVRAILPALGNDFVSMVKDSALVSVLGVADITQMAKVYASGSFLFFETYNVVALIYLVMTLALSLALRALERRLRAHERR